MQVCIRLFWFGLLAKSFIIFICLVSSAFASSSPIFTNESDRLALLDIRKYLINGYSEALGSWNDSLQFCQWQGVTCSGGKERVTELRIIDQNLGGFISPLIANLTFLRNLTLYGNRLRGSIPKDIGRLSQLQYLNLSENSLGGTIPVDIANCSKLQYLCLQSNNLVGAIPSSLGNLTSLSFLSFGRNNLSGNIPDDLGRLRNLSILRLYDNKLSGTVPFSLYNLSSVVELRISTNRLSGEFMPKTGLGVRNLRDLIVMNNDFVGAIPSALTNISGLETFHAAWNRLTGQVPSNLGALKNLQWFIVEYNSLGSGKSGDLDFFNSLANNSNLVKLGLKSNNFGGSLSLSLFNVSTQLQSVTFGSNAISGSIPEGIGKQIHLTELGLEENHLTGVIPSSIENVLELEKLDLSGNDLSGIIPSSLGKLTRLFYLNLERNNLEGGIPSSLRECNKLQRLLLAENKLSGRIPESLIGQLGQLVNLSLHQNSLSGPFPEDVGNLQNLGVISVSENKLTGEIPFRLGKCLGLQYLNMSNNLFGGSIPSSLVDLKALQFLDLSSNNLSGRIPAGLGNLSGLWSLNLSFNHLEGEVPTAGVFTNLSGFSFIGNGKLCRGVPPLQLPACASGQRKTLSRVSVIVISISSFGFVLLVLAILILCWKKRSKAESSFTSFLGEEYIRISYKELYDATGGFAPFNLVGAGSYGSVFKGVVGRDERPVAVKVFDLQKHGANNSFMAECRALGTIRHRNLLRILTSCSSTDFKGNEFRALVYDFMPKGSLHSWLYGTRRLSFIHRVEIAHDIASALVYLHYHCVPQVIHRDLKPSNVLLDNDMVAHVGDFGLAKVLYSAAESQSESMSWLAIRGTVGYVAPEYGTGRMLTTYGDVYSYGILLLELITAKRPTDDIFIDGLNLHSYAKNALPEKLMEIVDPFLLEEFEHGTSNMSNDNKTKSKIRECLLPFFEIGVACSAESPFERMNLKDVVEELQVIKTKFLAMSIVDTEKMQDSTGEGDSEIEIVTV